MHIVDNNVFFGLEVKQENANLEHGNIDEAPSKRAKFTHDRTTSTMDGIATLAATAPLATIADMPTTPAPVPARTPTPTRKPIKANTTLRVATPPTPTIRPPTTPTTPTSRSNVMDTEKMAEELLEAIKFNKRKESAMRSMLRNTSGVQAYELEKKTRLIARLETEKVDRDEAEVVGTCSSIFDGTVVVGEMLLKEHEAEKQRKAIAINLKSLILAMGASLDEFESNMAGKLDIASSFGPRNDRSSSSRPNGMTSKHPCPCIGTHKKNPFAKWKRNFETTRTRSRRTIRLHSPVLISSLEYSDKILLI
ncbi:Aste57867_8673 [Aphanomyces stellatus]|uniref:Aste57867_8673 protein n=1 Tax=Aphanomyces stellatus TaxID=120398 RepID=A0A485KKW2_9STRA|nr:hypothetical protein As57867_008639 [Aphanomyces stellatus]VFT85559.1 Aste57867_8673 [Aphanomyces stellatus]